MKWDSTHIYPLINTNFPSLPPRSLISTFRFEDFQNTQQYVTVTVTPTLTLYAIPLSPSRITTNVYCLQSHTPKSHTHIHFHFTSIISSSLSLSLSDQKFQNEFAMETKLVSLCHQPRHFSPNLGFPSTNLNSTLKLKLKLPQRSSKLGFRTSPIVFASISTSQGESSASSPIEREKQSSASVSPLYVPTPPNRELRTPHSG